MNFSPIGSHFSTSIPNIHQFAVKLSQDVSSASSFLNNPDDISLTNRYTANGIPSFTQHHHASTQQFLLTSNKNNGNYLNSNTSHNQVNCLKRANLEQQDCDLYSGRSIHQDHKILNHNEESKKKLEDPTKTIQIQNQQSSSILSNPWQNLTGAAVSDYLSQLPANSLPLSLHEFLKYSAETLKKDDVSQYMGFQPANDGNINLLNNGTTNPNTLRSGIGGGLNINNSNGLNTLGNVNGGQIHNVTSAAKKKKKKKTEKEKKAKPKPGEIRLSTALDGSTLYCCPECHMALPERDLLEQHLMGHNMERRFVCDICGAALKRKDHLTRHKQSHNPERPFVCSVCLKAFKRKEQLTLHFVIHSGEKRHVCTECGKGFYRKDHLRKHTRSHIARRVKAELSQQGVGVHSI